MRISATHLQLELQPRRKVDDEDWVRVQVLLRVHGFRGDFEAWLQLGDLIRFRDDIERMHENVGQQTSASLASAEPDIEIRLESQRLGGIQGTYRFESERLDGRPTALSGAFEIDQSHLPAIRASINDLIELLGNTPAQ
jgi:hypothetical protein